MRLALAVLILLGFAQSPFYDELSRREAQRRAFLEKEARALVAARPVAIAVRAGKPLAWVTVVESMDEIKHCGIATESFVYHLADRVLYRCTGDGARVPFAVDYSVILSPGPVTVVEWRGGRVEEHHLR